MWGRAEAGAGQDIADSRSYRDGGFANRYGSGRVGSDHDDGYRRRQPDHNLDGFTAHSHRPRQFGGSTVPRHQ